MDVRYTLLFLFLFLLGMINHAVYGAELPTRNPDDIEMDEEFIVDFIEREPLDMVEEIDKQNGIYKEIIVTFDFDETTMKNKKDNKKGLDIRLIKKNSIRAISSSKMGE